VAEADDKSTGFVGTLLDDREEVLEELLGVCEAPASVVDVSDEGLEVVSKGIVLVVVNVVVLSKYVNANETY